MLGRPIHASVKSRILRRAKQMKDNKKPESQMNDAGTATDDATTNAAEDDTAAESDVTEAVQIA